jgi:hypothetical protein
MCVCYTCGYEFEMLILNDVNVKNTCELFYNYTSVYYGLIMINVILTPSGFDRLPVCMDG